MGKQLYVINYSDNSHMALELDNVEYAALRAAIELGQRTVSIDEVGLLITTDIRSIILQKVEEEPQENPSYSAERTEAEKEWLKHNEWLERYYKEQSLNEEEDTDESDYPAGGMLP